MTETDDPKVKAHIACKHEQRLKRLSELTINEKELNNFFESRELKPALAAGWYNPVTKKYNLGPSWSESMMKPIIEWSTASAQTSVLTCAAGYRYKVIFFGFQNETRATAYTVSAVIGGVTAQIMDSGAGTNTVSETWGLGLATGSSLQPDVMGPIWLEAGDTITMSQTTYQAADNTEFFWYYEKYPVV